MRLEQAKSSFGLLCFHKTRQQKAGSNVNHLVNKYHQDPSLLVPLRNPLKSSPHSEKEAGDIINNEGVFGLAAFWQSSRQSRDKEQVPEKDSTWDRLCLGLQFFSLLAWVWYGDLIVLGAKTVIDAIWFFKSSLERRQAAKLMSRTNWKVGTSVNFFVFDGGFNATTHNVCFGCTLLNMQFFGAQLPWIGGFSFNAASLYGLSTCGSKPASQQLAITGKIVIFWSLPFVAIDWAQDSLKKERFASNTF